MTPVPSPPRPPSRPFARSTPSEQDKKREEIKSETKLTPVEEQKKALSLVNDEVKKEDEVQTGQHDDNEEIVVCLPPLLKHSSKLLSYLFLNDNQCISNTSSSMPDGWLSRIISIACERTVDGTIGQEVSPSKEDLNIRDVCALDGWGNTLLKERVNFAAIHEGEGKRIAEMLPRISPHKEVLIESTSTTPTRRFGRKLFSSRKSKNNSNKKNNSSDEEVDINIRRLRHNIHNNIAISKVDQSKLTVASNKGTKESSSSRKEHQSSSNLFDDSNPTNNIITLNECQNRVRAILVPLSSTKVTTQNRPPPQSRPEPHEYHEPNGRIVITYGDDSDINLLFEDNEGKLRNSNKKTANVVQLYQLRNIFTYAEYSRFLKPTTTTMTKSSHSKGGQKLIELKNEYLQNDLPKRNSSYSPSEECASTALDLYKLSWKQWETQVIQDYIENYKQTFRLDDARVILETISPSVTSMGTDLQSFGEGQHQQRQQSPSSKYSSQSVSKVLVAAATNADAPSSPIEEATAQNKQKSRNRIKKKKGNRLRRRWLRTLKKLKGITDVDGADDAANGDVGGLLTMKKARSTNTSVMATTSTNKQQRLSSVSNPGDTQTPSFTDEEKYDRDFVCYSNKNNISARLDHFFEENKCTTNTKDLESSSDDGNCGSDTCKDDDENSDDDSLAGLEQHFNLLRRESLNLNRARSVTSSGRYPQRLSIVSSGGNSSRNSAALASTRSETLIDLEQFLTSALSKKQQQVSDNSSKLSSSKLSGASDGKRYRIDEVIQLLISEDNDWINSLDQSSSSSSSWGEDDDEGYDIDKSNLQSSLGGRSSFESLSQVTNRPPSSNVVVMAREALEEMKAHQRHLAEEMKAHQQHMAEEARRNSC